MLNSAPHPGSNISSFGHVRETFWERVAPYGSGVVLEMPIVPCLPTSLEAPIREASAAAAPGLVEFLHHVRGDEIAKQYWVHLAQVAAVAIVVVMVAMLIPFH